MEKKKKEKQGIGLALSGGGFRATLFHLGSLWRLNELGWLPRIDRICSVSGGSITAALLGHRWKKLNFNKNNIATNFTEEIATPIYNLCNHTIDTPSILRGTISVFSTVGDFMTARYKKYLFGNAMLEDLPNKKEGPLFIIYASNLQTGSSVRLSRPYLFDYKIGMIKYPKLSLAEAVTVSSAFPPFIAPIIIKTNFDHWEKTKGAYLFDKKKFQKKLFLGDGGIYDNLALEAVWKKLETVLVSDAGAPLEFKSNPWILKYSMIAKTLRSLNIINDQSRSLRKRVLVNKYIKQELKGVYWGIATNINNYELGDSMTQDNKITESLAKMRTRLNKFSKKEQGCLVNWGYALTDTAMRRHVLEKEASTGRWPIPKYKL